MQVIPLCVTVKDWPAMVRVPEREVIVELAATEKATEPLPLPDEPEVMEIQESLLEAVHVHAEAAVTATVPVVAEAVII